MSPHFSMGQDQTQPSPLSKEKPTNLRREDPEVVSCSQNGKIFGMGMSMNVKSGIICQESEFRLLEKIRSLGNQEKLFKRVTLMNQWNVIERVF